MEWQSSATDTPMVQQDPSFKERKPHSSADDAAIVGPPGLSHFEASPPFDIPEFDFSDMNDLIYDWRYGGEPPHYQPQVSEISDQIWTASPDLKEFRSEEQFGFTLRNQADANAILSETEQSIQAHFPPTMGALDRIPLSSPLHAGHLDDGFDYTEMDIDDDLHASDLSITSSAPRKETSARNTPMLLGISKSSEPPSVQLAMANSSVGLSTLTIGMYKKGPPLRKLAIECMRENLTEIEQRQKADHGESQAQSPQSCFPDASAAPEMFSNDGGWLTDQADDASTGSPRTAAYLDTVTGKERLPYYQKVQRRARNRENQRASRMYSLSMLLPPESNSICLQENVRNCGKRHIPKRADAKAAFLRSANICAGSLPGRQRLTYSRLASGAEQGRRGAQAQSQFVIHASAMDPNASMTRSYPQYFGDFLTGVFVDYDRDASC